MAFLRALLGFSALAVAVVLLVPVLLRAKCALFHNTLTPRESGGLFEVQLTKPGLVRGRQPVPRFRLYHEHLGPCEDASAEIVVFLNPLTLHLGVWNKTNSAQTYAEQGYCVYMFDFRGQGRSQPSEGSGRYPDSIDFPLLAKDTALFLHAVLQGTTEAAPCSSDGSCEPPKASPNSPPRGVHLVGWGTGAGVGLLVAQDNPDLVKSLVVCAFVSKLPSSLLGSFFGSPLVVQTIGLRSYSRLAAYSLGGTKKANYIFRTLLEEQDIRNFAEVAGAWRGFDASAGLSTMTVPVLYLHPKRDASGLSRARKMFDVSLIPDAQFIAVRGSHLYPLEHSDSFNAETLAFVAKHTAKK